ncbi:MAG: AAA family ATPase [Armatimonadetes bacterium CG07_land_8_20_14_0_80_59_28]|nr:MAG: AAA family ATPase [Armatimonadetes bacterium CG07_land_8_20_14_0_80_59_28]
MEFEQELDIYFRARSTLICIVSFEEERILGSVKAVCERTQRSLHVWDHADFFTTLLGDDGGLQQPKDALTLLEAIDKADGERVFVLKDFHQCWEKQPKVIRKLRNLAQKLKFTKKTIVISSPVSQLPEELRDDALVLEFPPPGVQELDGILGKLTATPGVKVDLTAQGRDKVLHSALGLSSNQAQRVFAKAIVSDGVLDERDIGLITSEKKQIIRESGALEFFSPTETIGDVGGLEVLKEWLRMRETAFTQEARDYGLPEPKGIALIGIPGTGKSLTAKMIAALWRLPLIRLDVGALFGGLVGQSEENTRRALNLAETVSPCLLWIDEIEKGLSSGGGGDSGTSMRVFQSILTWMQEKTKPVFIVATANNISMLPPELLRRGRFDEIFFLDLPTCPERKEIFEVHVHKRKRPIQGYDLDSLAAASEGYVGAEIEQAVIDAMYIAFNDRQSPGRDFTTGDVLRALSKQVPMSRSQREAIAALRQWLSEGRAQSASFQEVREAELQFVQLQIEPSLN